MANLEILSLDTATPQIRAPGSGDGYVANRAVLVNEVVGSSALTLTGATQTTSQPVLNATQTWNASGTTFTGLKLNVTDTASASGSNLLDIQKGGTSQFYIDKSGLTNVGGGLSVGSVTSNVTANQFRVYSSAGTAKFYVNGSANGVAALGSDCAFAWRSGTDATAGTLDLRLTRKAAASLQLGDADAAAPVAQTLSVQSVVAGTTDTAGANFTIRGSQSTGTGAAGTIVFQTASAAASTGTAQNALATVATIGPNTLTGSQTTPVLDLAQTWNTTGVATALKLNVTNTASGANSLLMDLQVGGNTKFNVDKAGITTLGISTGTTNKISGTNQLTVVGSDSGNFNLLVKNDSTGANAGAQIVLQSGGSSGSAGSVSAYGPNFSYQVYPTAGMAMVCNTTGGIALISANASGQVRFATGGDATSNERMRITSGGSVILVSGSSFGWNSTTLDSGTQDLFLTRKAAANLQLGAADAAAPVAQTFGVQSVVAGTSNTAGADFTIRGSQGTGTGVGGNIIFQVAPAGSSGTAQNALATALTINSSKVIIGNVFVSSTDKSGGINTFGIGWQNGTGSFYSTLSWDVTRNLYHLSSTNGIGIGYGTIGWYSGAGGTTSLDTGIARSAAGKIVLTDGSTGAASLVLRDAGNVEIGTSTGTKIGTATNQLLGFWNAAPIAQPTTAVASATVAATGTGDVVAASTTFDGYTIPQIVKALRNAGLLA